jgi:hypothetical protein
MLHQMFEEDAEKSVEQRQAEAAEAQRAADAEAGRKAHQQRQVKCAVKQAMDIEFDAAEARGEQTADYAELYLDLRERIDDYDEYSDFGRRPIGAVVENICKVMGIAFDPPCGKTSPGPSPRWRQSRKAPPTPNGTTRTRPTATMTSPTTRTKTRTTKTIPTASPKRPTTPRDGHARRPEAPLF